MAPFNPSARRDKLDSTCTGRMPGSAVRLGAIRVLVSAVFLMSMASGRPVHTISRFVCMGCERQGEFRHLYGSRQAATTHVGKSPHCRALGLGVQEISVSAGTGADVMAGGSSASGAAPHVRHQPSGYADLYCSNYCITWNILGYPELSQNDDYPRISWVMSGYPDLVFIP